MISFVVAMNTADFVPDDIETLKAELLPNARPVGRWRLGRSGAEAMVAHLKLVIAKLKHDRFGASSERGRKLLDQRRCNSRSLRQTPPRRRGH